MAIARVKIRSQHFEIKRKHTGSMCAIDQHLDPFSLDQRDQLLERHDKRGRTGHMIDEQQPGPIVTGIQDSLDYIILINYWKWEIYRIDPGTRLSSVKLDCVRTGVIAVICDQYGIP